jgi:hypothetical protein
LPPSLNTKRGATGRLMAEGYCGYWPPFRRYRVTVVTGFAIIDPGPKNLYVVTGSQ